MEKMSFHNPIYLMRNTFPAREKVFGKKIFNGIRSILTDQAEVSVLIWITHGG